MWFAHWILDLTVSGSRLGLCHHGVFLAINFLRLHPGVQMGTSDMLGVTP